jgi:molybdate transport system substrate-binding protein
MMRDRVRIRVAAMLAALSLVGTACAADPDPGTGAERGPLLVAAASDLMPAFRVLGEGFEEATGEEVVFSFGSSGQLAQQLVEGSPMDLYAAANAPFVERVLAAGVGDPESRATYAFGRLAIWAPDDGWGDWHTLDDVADDGRVRTIAIANPDHAPYGLAARQALESAGLWDSVQPRLVFGENVADSQRLAASGNADVAIVSHSLAVAADEAGDGTWVLVDDGLHEPLQQELVVITDDPDRAALARRFIDHLESDEGRQVMRRFGFLLPDAGSTGRSTDG